MHQWWPEFKIKCHYHELFILAFIKVFTYLLLNFCIKDLDFLPQHGSAQRKNPLGTPGARCYSPLSAVHTPPAIKEEEPVITSPTHTDTQNNMVSHWYLFLDVFNKQAYFTYNNVIWGFCISIISMCVYMVYIYYISDIDVLAWWTGGE